MPLELTIYILIGIILFGLLVAKLARDRAKRQKGALKLQFDQKAWHLGQTVSGKLILNARSSIQVSAINLYLRGESKRYEGSGSDGRVHYKKIYERKDMHIAGLLLSAGDTHVQRFSLPMPSNNLEADDEKRLRKPFNEDRMNFTVLGKIDCDGVDLDIAEQLVTVRTRSY